ncbi:MAG: Rpn family recombination-promoting nuclease/putative transposase [Capsulimonadaceae bacterium]
MPGENLKPTSDLVFRNLLGKQANEIITTFAINSVVEPYLHVTNVVIRNPFNMAGYPGSKESIVDVKAQDQDGNLYSIEMQMHGHSCFGQRAIYYPAKGFVDQLEAGQLYCALNPTIGINFLGYNMFDDDRMLHHIVFKDMQTNEHFEDLRFLQFFFVELGKMHKDWAHITTPLDRLAWFMKNGQTLNLNNLPPTLLVEPAIVKAVGELERMGADPQIREIYEAEEKARMADVLELQYAEEQGVKRGIERGIERGREEGREQGIRRGQQDLLYRQMTRHIGQVPPEIAAVLEMLTPSSLSELGEALLDFHSYAELEAWLSRR